MYYRSEGFVNALEMCVPAAVPAPIESLYADVAVLRAFRDASVHAKKLGCDVGDLPVAVLHSCLKTYFVPIKT